VRCKRNWWDARGYARAKHAEAVKRTAGSVPCHRHWSPSHKMLLGTGKISFGWKAGKREAEEIVIVVPSLIPLSS